MSVDDRLTRHGHISYLEIPAVDIEQSADFYEVVFGWKIERRGSGRASFDDGTGAVIGRWETGRAIAREPGLLPYMYVDHIDDAIQRVIGAGGQVLQSVYPEGDLWVATIRDPAGNVMGVWQAGPRRAENEG
jgi:predicted enzyme related to lactoylglutathione lyase